MSGAHAFSRDYLTARARFREAAEQAGFSLASYPIDARGPAGEQLTIDVAKKGRANPSKVLAVSSGTHGIEGYFGSAVQLSLLEALLRERSLPEHLGVVLIHAINPYGFAHKRRVNEDNIDLNRNFLLAGRPFEGAPPTYRELDALLNPKSAPRRVSAFPLRAGRALFKHGFRALKSAIAQGQYDYPQGLFFGGKAPSATQRILREHVRDWMGSPERVLHLDFHTGLGKWASYALCVDMPVTDQRVTQLSGEFGAEVVQGFDTKGVLYEINGALGPWLDSQLESTQYDCLLAEFGTYHSLRVLQAMRFENRVRLYAPHDAKLLRRARRELEEVFSPASRKWRNQVVHKGVRIAEQAFSALR